MIERQAQALIDRANTHGVSDIHLLPLEAGYGLYYRINGTLVPQSQASFDWGHRLIAYFKFQANMDVGERRRPQSGATSFQCQEEVVELRFSTITNLRLHESLVIRIIRQQRQEAGTVHTFFPEDIQALRYLVRRKSGLVLFSGPVGSGKTTTIYQLLKERIRKEPLQIITMEDPVEIYEPRFLQTEVNPKADISYDLLIKSSLRHHPDVLMIGEVRDEETARMMIRGALTGHLMIATIHAKDTRGVLARLEELRVTPAQLEQTLIGVVSQRLLPRYCPLCQGTCQLHCTHYDKTRKRAALFERLQGVALDQALTGSESRLVNFRSMNDQLLRAWRCGYIDSRTYDHFQVL